MDTRKAVANRLLELCEEKNLSVNALARISAVPPSTLKKKINGGSQNAGVKKKKKLCDGLEISLFDFFNTETFRTLEQKSYKYYFDFIINENNINYMYPR